MSARDARRWAVALLLSGALGCGSGTYLPPFSVVTKGAGATAPAPAATPTSEGERQAPPAPQGSRCPPTPAGVTAGLATGDRLGAIVVKDCDDHEVSLDSLCGADALWIFAAHGWCSHCQAASRSAEAIRASFAGRNLAAVNILVETPSGEPPSARDCRAWKAANGLDAVMALYDPRGATRGLWDNDESALSVLVDRRWVIVSKAHTDRPTELETLIDSALGKEPAR